MWSHLCANKIEACLILQKSPLTFHSSIGRQTLHTSDPNHELPCSWIGSEHATGSEMVRIARQSSHYYLGFFFPIQLWWGDIIAKLGPCSYLFFCQYRWGHTNLAMQQMCSGISCAWMQHQRMTKLFSFLQGEYVRGTHSSLCLLQLLLSSKWL